MKLPWAAEQALGTEEWNSIRMRMMFECCKWDMQSEDHAVLADFPLVLEDDAWQLLARQAEQLAAEVLAAESELLQRPELQGRLGLPRNIRKVLRQCDPANAPVGCARVMRFDFHLTPEGWRISEVNSDVPGGFIEAAGFAELMAEHYPAYVIPQNPARTYANAIAATAADGALVALVHATAHSDDAQVMHYLAQELRRRNIRSILVAPNHVRWDSGVARISSSFATATPDILVRFFPAEWLPNLRPQAVWAPWFCGGKTAMSNPGSAILTQSKRFPLVWDELTAPLATWRALLPESRDPSCVPSGPSADWVLKPVLGRVGEGVAIHGVTQDRAFAEILGDVKRNPSLWIAQRRFDTVPLQTHSGIREVCLGVFVVAAKAAGIYGRIAKKPLIDQDAQDVAVLIRQKEHR